MRSANSETQSSQTTNSNQTPIIRLIYGSPKGFNRQIAIGIHGKHYK